MEIMPATNNHPRLIKIYDAKSNIAWKSRYAKDTTVILRRVPAYNNGNTNCRDVSVKAAWYGLQYYINGAGKAVTYNKLAVVGDTKIAQCATLVYRTYMNGAGFRFLIPYTSQGITAWRNPSYFYPYDILDHRVKNGFSAIAKF